MKNVKVSLLLIIAICASSTAALAEPRLEKALEYLRAAKVEVEKAVAGRPGQKEKAIEAINVAIRHVEEARER